MSINTLLAADCESVGVLNVYRGKVKIHHTDQKLSAIFKFQPNNETDKILKLEIDEGGKISRKRVLESEPVCLGDFLIRSTDDSDSDENDAKDDVFIELKDEERYGPQATINIYPGSFIYIGSVLSEERLQEVGEVACSTADFVWENDSVIPLAETVNENEDEPPLEDGMMGLQLADMKVFQYLNDEWSYLYDKPIQLAKGKAQFNFSEIKGVCAPYSLARGTQFLLSVEKREIEVISSALGEDATLTIRDDVYADDTILESYRQHIDNTRGRLSKKDTSKKDMIFTVQF